MVSKKHNIILIGFMGSGKTSVGKCLADLLTYQFRDTDQLIERRLSDTISHIFAVQGEEFFRTKETDLLKELVVDLNNTVLSTGGGLPMKEQNSKLLKELGYVVFLKSSKETTLARLKGDTTRPLLQGEDVDKKVDRMLEIRTPIYEKTAHKTIMTDRRSIQEVAHLIMENYLKLI